MNEAVLRDSHAASTSSPAVLQRSWRAIRLPHLALALGVSTVLGAIQGVGFLLLHEGPWLALVGEPLVPLVLQALFLLPCLAVAASVRPRSLPRWVPFAVAAAVATMATAIVDWLVNPYLWLIASGVAPDIRAEQFVEYAWTFSPSLLTIGALSAFGAMLAADAARRDATLRNLQLEHARFARLAFEARLAALQARVEPRFLFETLSEIERLYERNAALGAKVLDELIVYLRAALPAIEEDASSTLGAELELAGTWLDIMGIRSGGRLTFAITDEAPGDARLAPMLLLPLVQCAAQGGSDRTRAVYLLTAESGGRVRVTIVGPASAFSTSAMSAAVDAVRERLDGLYGDTGSLALQPAMHDRSQAILEIPYERTDRRNR